jgi:hypothetical protein
VLTEYIDHSFKRHSFLCAVVLDKLLILSIIKHTQNTREGDDASVVGGIMGDLKILIILSESKHRNTTNNIIGVKRQHIFASSLGL